MKPESADGGDFERQFESLYGQNRERLVRVVLRRLWKGQTSAESVIQGVLLSFVGHLRGPDVVGLGGDGLWRLLFRIALRHCNNANHRTARARQSGRQPAQFSQGPGVEGQAYDPPEREQALEGLEREGWVEHVLVRLEQRGLDGREREVFRLKLAGHTIEDIAQKAGLTVGRVRAVAEVIKRTVQACIEEENA